MMQQQTGQTLRINIDPDACTDLACPCGGIDFLQVIRFKKASALIAGQEMVIPMPLLKCVDCETVYASPEALQDAE